MQRFRIVIGMAIVLAAIGLVAGEPTYIGANKCKMCHKVEYASWETMAHAKAFDRLKPEEQTKPECLKCHATGASAEMPGVQCESCHGPGSDYKGIKVMKDQAASVAAGLIIPDESTCKGCHENAPHDVKPFDYAAAKATGVHEKKKAE